MKPDYLRLSVLAALLVLPLLTGSIFSGGDEGYLASPDAAYAQKNPDDRDDHDDHEDRDEHGSHAEDAEDVEHGDHGVHGGEQSEHGDDSVNETADEHTDHAEHVETEDVDMDHSGHEDEGEAEDHAGHDHYAEDVVHLSADAIRLAGIKIATAGLGRIHRKIELPGEIGFNEDRLVHITPRFPGVAREVHGHMGAYVSEGEILAVLESNESLSRYNVMAPISGRIIEKHLAVGEFVAEDHDMFLVADLSTVWANCEVYAKDMAYVKQGARVRISAVGGGLSTETVLSYVAPVYDEETRSALARAVIVNDGDFWRPGTFIRAEIELELEGERLTIDKDAVQTLGEEKVVFVPGEEEGAFEFVPVLTGTNDDHSIVILSGLGAGAKYVASGAFELKAKMVTANMGAHAGHGH